MLRILHIVPSYLPARRYGGTIFAVHGLCKALAKRGHEVHVFTTNVDGNADSNVPINRPIDVEGVKVWYFPSMYFRRLYYSPLMQKALKERIKDFDLLHLHSIYLWPTWAAACAAKHTGVPYIVSPRGMLIRELIERKSRLLKSLWIRFIEKKTLEGAAAIHMTSELEAREAEVFNFRLRRVFVIPNGVDYKPLNSQQITSEVSSNIKETLKTKPFILFLGRINWKKGLDRLIPALSYVPDAHLVIAGNDEDNYTGVLDQLARTHKVHNRISFIGPVYDQDKVALLKEAAVFVLPSYSENFGNTVLEAMAVGCPVVVTPEVGIAQVVKDAGAGLVVEGDPKILGESIAKLLADTSERQRMGKSGQKTVQEQFTWDVVAKQMENAYHQILS